MSGIFDQIINYSPPLIVSGTVNYKGTWNASTNNPTLNSSPASSTKGDYYVVSTAGTQFGITFAIGDWIISNGTAWEKVDLTDAVSSVFGRTGAVVGVSTDYSAVGLTNTAIGASNPSTGAFTTVSTTTPIAGTSGGTGVNNGANTITIAGNVTHAGAFTQSFTATANTALTLPTTGTLATLAGSEALSNKTITASAFNGTVGATTASTGAFTTLSASGKLSSQFAQVSGATSGGTGANTGISDYLSSNFRLFSVGANASTNGNFQFYSQRSDDTNQVLAATISSTGLNNTVIGATTRAAASVNLLTSSQHIINTGSSSNVFTAYTNGGTSRWVTGTGGTESGSNSGSDFRFDNYNDAGAQISTAVSISRSTGVLNALNGLAVTGALSASTSISAGTGSPPVGGIINSVGTVGFATSDNVNSSLYIRNGSGGTIIGTDTGGVLRLAANGSTSSQVVGVFTSTGLAVTGTLTTSSTTLHTSSVSLTNGAAAALGTLTNAPVAGNPTKWIPIVDNGVTRYIPCW